MNHECKDSTYVPVLAPVFPVALSLFAIFNKSQSIFEAIPLALSSMFWQPKAKFSYKDTLDSQIPNLAGSALRFQHGDKKRTHKLFKFTTLVWVDCGRTDENYYKK